MIHFQCPRNISELDELAKTNYIVFLAGGISGCEDWQSKLVSLLKDIDNLVLINPRRENFDKNLISTEEQVTWEYQAIKKSPGIIFWFTPPTLNPITLFEYGKCLVDSNKNVIVGIHPEYSRKEDVIIQTKLYIKDDSPGHDLYWSPAESIELLAEEIKLSAQRHTAR